jgi:regulator of protease activity HflC (stomatin/prohibitin superfamily)
MKESIIGVVVILSLFILGGAGMYGCPRYNVYQQRMEGQAILAHAQSSREVAVAEAKAKMESAELLAQAEVSRAKGVAKANEIIGASLKGNEDYLRYLWIQNLEGMKEGQVIYVPTEAGLPILEANRLKHREVSK